VTTAVQDRPVSSRDRRPARAKTRAGRVYLYLVPAAVMLVAIFAVPLADSVVLSLQNSVGIAGTAGWAGFSNFAAELSSSVFWQITWQTIIWTVGVVSLTTVISIVLASLLRQAFRGRTIFTALLMIPWASSIAVSAVVWLFAFEPNGLVDRTLTVLGLKGLILPWLANTPQSMVVLILVGVWVSVPFTTLIISAGMNGIPREIYEAASLESTSRLHLEWFITRPLLRHVILVSLMANFVVVFNSFPIIYVMTGGGPINNTNILATYLYEKAFTDLEFAQASAIAVLVSVFLLTITFIYVRFLINRPSPYQREARVG
jgi:multiple sugar transport system permease protein